MGTFVARRIAPLVLAGGFAVACTPRSPAPAQPAPARSAAALQSLSLATAPDRFLAAGDVRLRYREIGRGEPVVLLHGMTRDLDDWRGVADSLALDRHVIALDERGFGQSSKFTEPARFGTAMADDVVRLLDHLRIRRAHLVGHSMGAAVAANVAARYPERVASASLLAPPSYADSAAFAQSNAGWVADLERGAGMGRFFQWLFLGMPDCVAAGASTAALAANPPATVAAVFRSMSALMIPASRAGTVRVPALVAVGSHDPLLARARWLASWWPRARLLEVPDADHGTIAGRPEVLAAVRALMQTRTTSRMPSAHTPEVAHAP